MQGKTTSFVIFEPTSLLTDPVCERGKISVLSGKQYAIWFTTFEKSIEKRMAAAYKVVIYDQGHKNLMEQ